MAVGSVQSTTPDSAPDTTDQPTGIPRWLVVAAWAVAALSFLPALVQTLHRRWAADAFLHAAVFRDIAAHPLHPVEPIIGGDQGSPYITPFSLPIGWLLRLFGGSGYDGLTIAAIVNTVLLVAGVVLLTRAVSKQPLAAPLALIFTMLLWGSRTWVFSGVLALNSLGFVLPYPSTTGIALLLLHWAVLLHFLRRRSWWLFALLVIIAVVIATVHAFSAGCDGLGLVLIVLWQRKLLSWKVAGWLAAGAVVAGVLTLIWPYYSVLKLSNAGPAYSAIHQSLYVGITTRGYLLLFCVPLLARRWWRDKLDPFALGFVVTLAIYAFGGLSGQYAFGRIITLVALCAQVGAALELADWLGAAHFPEPGRMLPIPAAAMGTAVVAFGCCLGIAGSGDGLVQAIPRSDLLSFIRQGAQRVPDVTQYDYLDQNLGEGDVVIASAWRYAVPALANGGTLVVSPYPDAFTPDDTVRRTAVASFFAASATPAQRAVVLTKYHVKWVLWGRTDGPVPPALGAPVGTSPDGTRLYHATAAQFSG
jgi:alpha-1,6-mannosyltransferase